MPRYIEGYYSKDDQAADNLSNAAARKILDALERLYPWGGTTEEIARETGIPPGTVYNYLKHELGMFAKWTNRPKLNKTGERMAGRGWIRFDIENQSFALNEHNGFPYHFSPGYVNYKQDFLAISDSLIEKAILDEIHSLLVKLLARIFLKIESPTFDTRIKVIAPRVKARSAEETRDMICNGCGINHEARDFIRAILLRIVDQIETNDDYINFLWDKRFVNPQAYNLYQELFQSSKAKYRRQLKALDESKEMIKKESKKADIVKLRVVSIDRDCGDSKIPFLAMNEHGIFLQGTIDAVLVTDEIVPDALIACTPSELDYDEYYIVLSKDKSYIKILENDPSFKKPFDRWKISNISGFYRDKDEFEVEHFQPIILEADILQKPENLEITGSDGEIVPVTCTIIGDHSGQINLYQFRKSSLSQLSVGDRIKILGAMAARGKDGEVELRMNQYSTIVKLSPSEGKSDIIYNNLLWIDTGSGFYPRFYESKESKRVLVRKSQVKSGIKFELNEIKLFDDYTEARISIGNMNPDAELRLLENDTGAFQNSKRFSVNEVVRDESPYHIRGAPFIKPKISPSATFPHPIGIVRFKPLDHSKNKAKFKFNINKKTIQDNYDFTFDVSLEQAPLFYSQALEPG